MTNAAYCPNGHRRTASVRMKFPWGPGAFCEPRTLDCRPVQDMALPGPAGPALTAPGPPLRAVNGRQDCECVSHPKKRRGQHQGNFQLSAHTCILSRTGAHREPAPGSISWPYRTPSSPTVASTSCTVTASRAGSGSWANVSPRRSSARVRTTWGPGGGPQISGGAGPNKTTDGVP